MPSASDLVVEDGSGLDTANTYSDIAGADTYHDLRGNTAWTSASESDKVVALIDATQYLDIRWTFQGEPTNPSDPDTVGQALQWPRTAVSQTIGVPFAGVLVRGGTSNVVDSRNNEFGDDEVPFWIVDATREYALASLAAAGRLLPDPTVSDDAGRAVTLEREKVSSLETETRFDANRARRVTRTYAMGDRLIRQSGLAVLGGRRAIRA